MDLTGLGVTLPGRHLSQTESGRIDGVDLHAQFYAERTGGDFFDTVRVGARLAFLLTDIAGRRPEVDLITAEVQGVFRAISTELFTAADVNLMEAAETLILAINNALIGISKGVRFAPTFVGCYDLQLGVLAYINAGGQTAVFQDSEGTRALPNVAMPLGLFTHLTYDASIQAFEPEAVLLVVTKGVTESMRGGDAFGPDRVIEVLQRSKFESANAVCSAVLDAAHQFEKRRWSPFHGRLVRDDMTALAMLRTSQAG